MLTPTHSTFNSLSCDIGTSLFKDYTCKSQTAYQIQATGIIYLVEKNGKTFQMKIKQMSEEELKNYKHGKAEKTSLTNNEDILPNIVAFQKIKNAENQIDQSKKIESDKIKIQIDSNPNQLLKNEINIAHNNSENLKQKIEKFENKYVKSKSHNVVFHYSVVNVPTNLNVELNESILLYKLKDKPMFQNLEDFAAINGFKVLILEHFENGSLREFLNVQNSLPYDKRVLESESDKMMLFSKLTNAINVLNQSGYVHTNLSPDTIYIDDEYNPVIAGFDFVQELQSLSQINPLFFTNEASIIIQNNDDLSPIKTPIRKDVQFSRNFSYVAPEIILAKDDRVVLFTSKIDSYSLGAVYYYILYSNNPFDGDNDAQVLESLKRRYILVKAGTSNNSIRILIKTLSLDPSIRLNSFQLEYNIEHELKFGLDVKILNDAEISTDILYTSRYGRTFFDKYSEMIFILIMAFVVIPSTVFIASYKFKQDQRYLRDQNNNQNQNDNQNTNNANEPQEQNQNNINNFNQPDLQIALGNRLV